MPPYTLDMTASPVTDNPIYNNAGGSGSYNVANGAYYQGNNIFYIKDQSIYSQYGPNMSSNNPYVTPLARPGSGSIGGEIVILPVPGACKEYYVIYSYYYSGPEVLCTKVRYNSNGTISVDKGNGYPPLTGSGIGTGSGYMIASASVGFTGTNSDGTGLAASKLHPDPNGNGYIYYLYMFNGGTVYYATIGTPGIGTANAICNSGIFGQNYCSTEMELSENEEYLAFNGIDPTASNILWNSDQIEVVQLTSPTAGSPVFSQGLGSGYVISGLEFVGNATPVLYVVGRAGNQSGYPLSLFRAIDIANLNNGWWMVHPQTQLGAPFDYPYQVMNSQLEYSKSGKLCYISYYGTNRYFVEYDPASTYNNPIAPTVTYIDGTNSGPYIDPQATNSSIHQAYLGSQTYGVDGFYTLPDQIDGGDYDYTTVTIGGMTINGNTGPGGCGSGFMDVYNCGGIYLDATFEGGSPCKTFVEILPVNVNCELLVGSTYFTHSAYLPNQLTSNAMIESYDLRDHHGSSPLSLYTTPGYYVVAVTIMDCCLGNQETRYFPIRVLEGVDRYPSMYLYDMNNYSITLPISHNINSPVDVGAVSVEFELPANLGSVTQMNVRVQEVNYFTGVPGNTIVDDAIVYSNPTNGAITVNLNNLCANAAYYQVPGGTSCPNMNYTGRKSYFTLHGVQILNQRYKLTVDLYNQCSSGSVWTYFEIVDPLNRPLSVGDAGSNIASAQLYPNPTSGDLKLKLDATKPGNYSFSLFDLSGRLVKTLQINRTEAGEQETDMDVSGLDNGVYLWEVNSGSYKSNGKVTVLR